MDNIKMDLAGMTWTELDQDGHGGGGVPCESGN
jgi:hypothetical protein